MTIDGGKTKMEATLHALFSDPYAMALYAAATVTWLVALGATKVLDDNKPHHVVSTIGMYLLALFLLCIETKYYDGLAPLTIGTGLLTGSIVVFVDWANILKNPFARFFPRVFNSDQIKRIEKMLPTHAVQVRAHIRHLSKTVIPALKAKIDELDNMCDRIKEISQENVDKGMKISEANRRFEPAWQQARRQHSKAWDMLERCRILLDETEVNLIGDQAAGSHEFLTNMDADYKVLFAQVNECLEQKTAAEAEVNGVRHKERALQLVQNS